MDVTPQPVRKHGEMSASLSCFLFFIQTGTQSMGCDTHIQVGLSHLS